MIESLELQADSKQRSRAAARAQVVVVAVALLFGYAWGYATWQVPQYSQALVVARYRRLLEDAVDATGALRIDRMRADLPLLLRSLEAVANARPADYASTSRARRAHWLNVYNLQMIAAALRYGPDDVPSLSSDRHFAAPLLIYPSLPPPAGLWSTIVKDAIADRDIRPFFGMVWFGSPVLSRIPATPFTENNVDQLVGQRLAAFAEAPDSFRIDRAAREVVLHPFLARVSQSMGLSAVDILDSLWPHIPEERKQQISPYRGEVRF